MNTVKSKVYSSAPQGMRILAFKVSYTAGVPAFVFGGTDATLADTGTGIFTVTLNEPGQHLVYLGGGVEDDSDVYVLNLVEATTQGLIRLQVATDAGAAADPDDGIVHFAVGVFYDSSN